MKKITVYILLLSLLLTLSPSPAIYAQQARNEGTEAEAVILNSEWLSRQYGVTGEWIQTELNKGYTLPEIYRALDQAKRTGATYDEIVRQLNPAVQAKQDELARMVDETVKYQSTVSSDVYGTDTVTGDTYFPTVTEETYGPTQQGLRALSERPSTYDEAVLKRLEVKTDQAPFSISSNQESVSNVTGDLSLRSTDLVLPGRNGHGFALTRQYDSSQSQYFDKDVDVLPVYNMTFLPKFRVNVFFHPYGNTIVTGGDFYMIDQFDFNYVGNRVVRNVGQSYPDDYEWYYRFYPSYAQGVMELEKKKLETGTYKYRDPQTEQPFQTHLFSLITYQTGVKVNFMGKFFPTGEVFLRNASVVGQTVRNAARDNLPQSPLGKGWSWDIPAIETKRNTTYLRLQGGSSYEIGSDSKLIGYPWKDLTLASDSNVVVNGKRSSRVLTSTGGLKQYFASDGKLIASVDAYGNTTQLYYTNVSPYGEVLTKVIDAIGNEANLSYTSTEVLVTTGDKTIRYQKQQAPNSAKELLTAATDEAGRTSRYSYDVAAGSFNLLPNYSEPENNYYALLKGIEHPTGAKTEYGYTKMSRVLGKQGESEEFYRVQTREDAIYYVNGTQERKNKISFSGGDTSYGTSTTFQTTADNGLTRTVYSYKKQYIDEKTPSAYYATEVSTQAGAEKEVTKQVFDETRKLPVPNEISTTVSNASGSGSTLTTKRTYDEYGNVLTETNPMQVTTTNTYDPVSHLLVTATQPVNAGLSSYTELQRNAQGSVTQLTVKDNGSGGALKQQVNYGYDSYGNVTQLTMKDTDRSSTITQEYDPKYGSAFVTRQSVNVTDAAGQVSTVTQQAEYRKDTGALIKHTDAKGYATSYQYDKLGRVIKETNADGSETSIAYDDAGNKVTMTDATGRTLVGEYNPLGEKVRETVGTGFATYGYDTYGRLVWSKDAKQNPTNYAYDNWSRLSQTTYADGSSAKTSYDSIGRTKTAIDEEGNTLRERYDSLGRVIQTEELKAGVSQSLGTVTYDLAGHATEKIDGKGNRTGYGYDSLGRLLSVTDPDGKTTRYTYSLAGNLTELQYADGNVQRKKYDEMGRLIQKIRPQGEQETYTYDLNSNLIKKVDRKGIAHHYEYNNLNRLVKDSTPEESIAYTYDLMGRRASMADNTGTTVYRYGPTGELVSMQYPDGYTVDYAYDIQGQRTETIGEIGYAYNERNRVTGITIKDRVSGTDATLGTLQYQYKKNGFVEETGSGTGLRSVYTYDGLNMTGLNQTNKGATAGTYGYTYDVNRNITQKTEPGASFTFTYDKQNRIATSSQFNELYGYDDRGNRASLSSDRVPQDSGGVYEYDERDRLKKVTGADGTVTTYRYNGDGLLYERSEKGTTTRYYYDDAGLLIRESSVEGGQVKPQYQYVYSSTGAIQARKSLSGGGKLQYYTLNGHGDVVGLYDSDGKLLNAYSYDIWGNPVTENETVPNPFRYSGEFWDNTTKLQYLRARWYDPNMGRFINEDTYEGELNNTLSLNLYTYVGNNPLKYRDPSGHKKKGVDFSFATFLMEFRDWGTTELVEAWWEYEITDQEFLGAFGIEHITWEDATRGKGTGSITYEDKAEPGPEEVSVAGSLSLMGKNVVHLVRRNDLGESGIKTPDFLVDGIKTELKTLTSEELKWETGRKRITDAIRKQSAETAILDIRKYNNYNALDIFRMFFHPIKDLQRNGSLWDNTELQIWTVKGIYKLNVGDVGNAI
ncbi:RHS repeat-associated core domain-containing protein [Paenibacillus sp. 1P03SA]|uniref:RHS repeat-associated core domain-containing protein n=1 Tax=Paenibacillus sp. 1P03SA TaxID=3132294 RepID=UPI0039A14BF3